MSILVTGGAGALGSNLVNTLAKDKEKSIIVIDDLRSGKIDNLKKQENIIFIKGSSLNDKILDEAFSYKIDTVFHLAAFFANQNSVEHPEEDLEVNGKGTLKILDFSVKNKIKKFVYASSSCVYGNKKEKMREEDTEFELETPYAITKLLGEYYSLYFYRLFKLPVVILRYFNSYGPGDYPGKYRGVIPNFIKSALEGKPLIITGTGDETRAFTYIDDVIRGTILAATNNQAIGEIFNIGSDMGIKIIEVAEKINRLAGRKSEIQFTRKRIWDNIARRNASLEKSKKILAYEPKINFDHGLKLTVDWLKNKLAY